MELLEHLAIGMAEHPDPGALSEELLSQAADVVGAEAGSLLLFEPARDELVFRAVIGPVASQLRGTGIPITASSLSGSVFLSGQSLLISDVNRDLRWFPGVDQQTGYTTHSQVLAPLNAAGRRIGVICLLNPTRGTMFGESDVALLQKLAGPIAVAMENARLFEQLRDAHLETVRLLAAAVEAKDLATLNHIERVSGYAVKLAGAVGVAGRELLSVEFGAILHDVGKVGVDSDVLHKTEPLDEEEWGKMRMHPVIGARILSHSAFLSGARDAVRHHHERWDGGGYPDGLAGEAIPLAARIVSVADAFDAMTSDRPYRSSLAVDSAVQRLRQGAGQHWDPSLVDVFVRLWKAGEVIKT
jgi:hypothetical protein